MLVCVRALTRTRSHNAWTCIHRRAADSGGCQGCSHNSSGIANAYAPLPLLVGAQRLSSDETRAALMPFDTPAALTPTWTSLGPWGPWRPWRLAWRPSTGKGPAQAWGRNSTHKARKHPPHKHLATPSALGACAAAEHGRGIRIESGKRGNRCDGPHLNNLCTNWIRLVHCRLSTCVLLLQLQRLGCCYGCRLERLSYVIYHDMAVGRGGKERGKWGPESTRR